MLFFFAPIFIDRKAVFTDDNNVNIFPRVKPNVYKMTDESMLLCFDS